MRALRISNRQTKESLEKIITAQRKSGIYDTEIRKFENEYAIYYKRNNIKKKEKVKIFSI